MGKKGVWDQKEKKGKRIHQLSYLGGRERGVKGGEFPFRDCSVSGKGKRKVLKKGGEGKKREEAEPNTVPRPQKGKKKKEKARGGPPFDRPPGKKKDAREKKNKDSPEIPCQKKERPPFRKKEEGENRESEGKKGKRTVFSRKKKKEKGEIQCKPVPRLEGTT